MAWMYSALLNQQQNCKVRDTMNSKSSRIVSICLLRKVNIMSIFKQKKAHPAKECGKAQMMITFYIYTEPTKRLKQRVYTHYSFYWQYLLLKYLMWFVLIMIMLLTQFSIGILRNYRIILINVQNIMTYC